MNGIGKIAMVTGAGTGIGKAVALALLAERYSVVLTGRRREVLGDNDVLHRQRHAGERAERLTGRPRVIDGAGRGQRAIDVDLQERVQRPVENTLRVIVEASVRLPFLRLQQPAA